MAVQERDLRQWAVLAGADETLFAERPTREEAEAVVGEYDALIRRHFGVPRIVSPVVVDLAARRRAHAAFEELERRGFIAEPG